MARDYRPVVRDQEFLLPPNMADWLPSDHLVWFVIDVLDRLDTTAFHRRRRRGGVGRQGFDPDMLLGLWIYAYAVGERSSRRIEQLCRDHVAFRVLCGQDAPDHTTLARFRAEHEAELGELFSQVLRLCAQAGMVRVGVVAIDGTKIAADAARGANRTAEWIRQEAARLAAQILAESAAVDAAEDVEAAESDQDDAGHGDGLPPGLGDRDVRAAAIAAALAEVERQDAAEKIAEAAGEQRVADYVARLEAGESIPGLPPAGIDPVVFHRARIGRFERRLAALTGVSGARASQQRRDAKRALARALAALAAAEQSAAEGATADLRTARQRARDRREARRGSAPTVNVTDPDSRLMTTACGGSVQGFNAQFAVTDDHLVLGVHLSQDANDKGCFAPTLQAAQRSADMLGIEIGTVLADAGYFTEHNLTTPGPDRLIAPGKRRDLAALPAETLRPEATALQRMRHRLATDEADAELYKRRSATVETVIAHHKELTGLKRFTRRGLSAANAELHLAALVHNLRRMHTAAPALG